MLEALIANPVLVCVTLMRFAQLKKVLGSAGSKIGPLRRHLDSTCWGSTFGHLYKGNVFKKDQKVDPFKSKVVPSGGSSFGPFIVANLLKRFKLKLISPATAATGILNCSRPLLLTRCWFLWRWCVSRSWRRCLGGLKIEPPRRHWIQPVEGPVYLPAKETCLKKG